MSFMQVELSGPEKWIVLDGPYGTEVIPCDVCGELLTREDWAEDYSGDNPDEDYIRAAFAGVADYAENRECWSIAEETGWCGRMSAPGYMDCTEWMGPYDSATEARRAVIDQFELCPACEDYADSPNVGENPACNFYHF